jgi:hypothetical protein
MELVPFVMLDVMLGTADVGICVGVERAAPGGALGLGILIELFGITDAVPPYIIFLTFFDFDFGAVAIFFPIFPRFISFSLSWLCP